MQCNAPGSQAADAQQPLAAAALAAATCWLRREGPRGWRHADGVADHANAICAALNLLRLVLLRREGSEAGTGLAGGPQKPSTVVVSSVSGLAARDHNTHCTCGCSERTCIGCVCVLHMHHTWVLGLVDSDTTTHDEAWRAIHRLAHCVCTAQHT